MKKVAFGNYKMPVNRAFLHKENFFEQEIAHVLRSISYVIKNAFPEAFFIKTARQNIQNTQKIFKNPLTNQNSNGKVFTKS